MTVENISWSISTKECYWPRRGLNPWPPGRQSDGASNWATEAGIVFFFNFFFFFFCKIWSKIFWGYSATLLTGIGQVSAHSEKDSVAHAHADRAHTTSARSASGQAKLLASAIMCKKVLGESSRVWTSIVVLETQVLILILTSEERAVFTYVFAN